MFKKISEFKSNAVSSIKNVFIDSNKRKNVIIYTIITALISVLFSFFSNPDERITDFYMSIYIPALFICFLAIIVTEAINASSIYMVSSIILVLMGIALQLRLFDFEEAELSFSNFGHLKMVLVTLFLSVLAIPVFIFFIKISDKNKEIRIPKEKKGSFAINISVKKVLLVLVILAIVALYAVLVIQNVITNGSILSVEFGNYSFQIAELTKLLSIIGFTFAYTLPRENEEIETAEKGNQSRFKSIVSKAREESGFIISLIILAINGLFLLYAKELGTLLIIGIMFCVQTVLHHPKGTKRLLPIFIAALILIVPLGSVMRNSYENVVAYKAYEKNETEAEDDNSEKLAEPSSWENKLYNFYLRFDEYFINLKLLVGMEDAVLIKEDDNYKPTQSDSAIEAMMLGGMFGSEYDPIHKISELDNDIAFAFLTLKLGVLNAILIILLLIVMLVAAIKKCIKNPNHTTASLAIALSVMLTIQTLVSAMSALGFLPIIGVQIPFIGSGGSYLLVSFITLLFVIYATSDLNLKSDSCVKEPDVSKNPEEE